MDSVRATATRGEKVKRGVIGLTLPVTEWSREVTRKSKEMYDDPEILKSGRTAPGRCSGWLSDLLCMNLRFSFDRYHAPHRQRYATASETKAERSRRVGTSRNARSGIGRRRFDIRDLLAGLITNCIPKSFQVRLQLRETERPKHQELRKLVITMLDSQPVGEKTSVSP